MAMLRRLKALLPALALVPLVACTSLYRNHGYVPPEEDLAEVSIGATQQEVARAIGRPTATGLVEDTGWYYVRSRYRDFAYRRPEEVDREVVAVSFADDGTVTNIERFGLEEGNVVVLSRRVTDRNTEGIGFLRQLLGNLGRFDAAQILGEDG